MEQGLRNESINICRRDDEGAEDAELGKCMRNLKVTTTKLDMQYCNSMKSIYCSSLGVCRRLQRFLGEIQIFTIPTRRGVEA